MKHDRIISYFRACKTEVEEETKEIRKIWEKSLDQYLCRKDFGKKQDWQFKTYVPISKPIIKKAVRLIKKIMLGAEDYFDFVTPAKDKEKKKLCNITKRVVKTHLLSAKFIDEFCKSLESSFVMAMHILKFWVAEENEHFGIDADKGEIVYPKKAKLRVKAINPFNFYFTRDNSIQIEDEYVTVPKLKEMVENTFDSAGNYVYDIKNFKKLVRGDYTDSSRIREEDTKRLERLGLEDHVNSYRKEVLLSHFWGPLIDKKGNVVQENIQMIIANEQYVLLQPRDNPFWHKKSPYVYGSPLGVLFRHIGKGLTEDVMGIEEAVVDFVNLQLDNLLLQVHGADVIDEMAFTQEEKAKAKNLQPGTLLAKRTGYQGSALEHIQLGTDPNKSMPMLQELKQFHEQEHGVTEYVGSQPGAASEKASIYAGKQRSAMGDFQAIAMDIERNFLVECLDRARDLILQYLADFDGSPNISSIFGDEGVTLDGLSEDQKRAMIVSDFDFVGRGISVFFDRMEKIEKLGTYVKMINALPDEAQLYPRWDAILKRIHEAFAFDRAEELVLTDEEVAHKQKQIAQQQMQQTMMAVQQWQQEQAQEMEKQARDLQMEQMKLMHDAEENQKDRKLKMATELMK